MHERVRDIHLDENNVPPSFNGNVIDFEASGLSSDSYPIEVGVTLSGTLRYSALICPQDDWVHWCQEAQTIHRLKRDELFRYGKPVEQVCSDLNAICRDQVLYSDGWVCDHSWMLKLYQAARVQPSFSCSPLEYLLGDKTCENWTLSKDKMAKRLGITAHEAANDSLIISRLVTETLEKKSLVEECSHIYEKIRRDIASVGSRPPLTA